MSETGSPQRAPRRTGLIVALAIFVIICVVGGILGGTYLLNTYTQISDVQNSQDIVPKLPEGADAGANGTAEQLANAQDVQEGTIDFETLQKTNPDVYAWLYIPNTHVNYAVCQSAERNDYYLTHAADGSESQVGAIFSEAQFNHKDFNDRVTVLYGHNGYADVMFSDLHNYELQEYVDAHNKIYVYTPGKVRTYEVFSTFSAGDRHIMDAFDLTSDEGFETFVNYVKSPESLDAHVANVQIDAGDKVLVLSTCNTGALESQGRYLVCGVLVDEQAAE